MAEPNQPHSPPDYTTNAPIDNDATNSNRSQSPRRFMQPLDHEEDPELLEGRSRTRPRNNNHTPTRSEMMEGCGACLGMLLIVGGVVWMIWLFVATALEQKKMEGPGYFVRYDDKEVAIKTFSMYTTLPTPIVNVRKDIWVLYE